MDITRWILYLRTLVFDLKVQLVKPGNGLTGTGARHPKIPFYFEERRDCPRRGSRKPLVSGIQRRQPWNPLEGRVPQ